MAAYSYEYRVQRLYSVPAQVVGELCEQLEASEGGLTPKTFVDASRDPKSPTHSMLEWDNKIAAEAYREEQAKHIIANVRIVRAEAGPDEYKDRGFVVIHDGRNAYTTIHKAMSNDEWREHLLKDAKRDMECFKAKYRRLTELTGVIAEMDKVMSHVD